MKKIFSALLLTFWILSALELSIKNVHADATIFIRPDGSIYPLTASILKVDVVYTFTENIYAEIVVQKSNITLDGVGFRLEGNRELNFTGIQLSEVYNVTVKRIQITKFFCAVKLASSRNCTATEINITNSDFGIWLDNSADNVILRNNFENIWCGINVGYSERTQILENTFLSSEHGITLHWSTENILFKNNLIDNESGINLEWSTNNTIIENWIRGEAKNNWQGIRIHGSSNNTFSRNSIEDTIYAVRLVYYAVNNKIKENNISRNFCGIFTWYASNNILYKNRFIDNNEQAKCYSSSNTWDLGYPEGGNYWSNYAGVDEKSGVNQDQLGSDGIGDTPFIIDEENVDHYPLLVSSSKPGFFGDSILFYVFIAVIAVIIFVFLFILYKKSRNKSFKNNL